MRLPAALGGEPAFPNGLRFARPITPPLDDLVARLRPSYEAGELTNGRLIRELEERLAAMLEVDHVVAVSSCTTGLLLTLQALTNGDGDGVVLPSFTFSATAHAVVWNGLTPVFAECDPLTLQVDAEDAEKRLAAHGARAILATHVFGAPAPVEALEDVAARHGVPLVFDAAHGLGMRHGGRRAGGFGTAEVFSMSPTKLVVAGEGGAVSTNDAVFAATLRMGRDYGHAGDYDTLFPGLNARMSEFHCAMALESLDRLDAHVEARRASAKRYAEGLSGLPGLRVPTVAATDEASYKDFTVIFDDDFGLSRDLVADALLADGVQTRKYFSPPVHRHQAYARGVAVDLPVTDTVAASVLSLPMFGDLAGDEVNRVVETLRAVHEHTTEIADRAIPQPTT